MFLYIGGVCCSDRICIYGGVFILEGPNFVGPCFEGPNFVGPYFGGPWFGGPSLRVQIMGVCFPFGGFPRVL